MGLGSDWSTVLADRSRPRLITTPCKHVPCFACSGRQKKKIVALCEYRYARYTCSNLIEGVKGQN